VASPDVKGNEQSREADIMAVLFRRFEAIKNKDESAIRAIIDERYNKFDDWPPFGRQEGEEALKSEFGAFKVLSNYNYELKDAKTMVIGDAAVTTSMLHYRGEMRNRPFEISSRVTFVLNRSDVGWKLVHEHYSRFQGEQSNDQPRTSKWRFPW
jgi:ketosteroid isomerase-like protein